MLRTSLASAWFHRRRFVATGLAVVLGVGFLVASTVLSDAIRSAGGRWRESSSRTDVVIRGAALYTTNQGRVQYDSVPESAVARVASVSGVAAVNARNFTNQVLLLDHEGRVVSGWQGRFVRSWPSSPEFALTTVVVGRAPRALAELTMDRAMAAEHGFRLGERVAMLSRDGRREMRLVGLTAGDAVDFGDGRPGAMAVTLAQAQALAGERGLLDGIDVIASHDRSAEDLAERISSSGAAHDLTVMTGAEVEAERSHEFRQRTRFLTALLLVFSAVALFVSAFIIANTFAILVSQRAHEHALLRAVGASRAQLAGSVLFEAALVGIVAGGLGVVAGLGLARGSLGGLGGIGLALPRNLPLHLEASRAVEAIGAGLAVTVSAAALPAARAMNVRPLVSLRAVEVDESPRSQGRLAGGLLATSVGGVLVSPAFTTTPSLDAIKGIGAGAGLLLLAVIVICPTITAPLLLLLGAVTSRTGPSGLMATRNTRRNPRRTAATISALIVGVALVGFVTVLAQSARTSVHDRLAGGFRGDYLVTPAEGRSRLGVDPVLADRLAAVDGVRATTALTGTTGQFTLPDGARLGGTVTGIEPRSYPELFRIEMTAGSIDDLSGDGILVNRLVARDHGLRVGDRVQVIGYETKRATFTIVGTVDERSLLTPWTTTTAGVDRLTRQRSTQLVAVAVEPGRLDELRPKLERVVDDFPPMQLTDRDTFAGPTVEGIGEVVNMLYALLAVSVVIAVIGITNTLSLSVHERTREIGLLRAVGMSQKQVRSMIRSEAVTVAVLGTTIGLAAGLGIAFTVVTALRPQGLTTFDVPLQAMAGLLVGGAVLGAAAAVRPAVRASRIEIVSAVAER